MLPSVRDVPRRVYVDSMGYDGQFYAQLAVDPLLQSPGIENALDAPAYRARRILLSWTAYVFGFRTPRLDTAGVRCAAPCNLVGGRSGSLPMVPTCELPEPLPVGRMLVQPGHGFSRCMGLCLTGLACFCWPSL